MSGKWTHCYQQKAPAAWPRRHRLKSLALHAGVCLLWDSTHSVLNKPLFNRLHSAICQKQWEISSALSDCLAGVSKVRGGKHTHAISRPSKLIFACVVWDLWQFKDIHLVYVIHVRYQYHANKSVINPCKLFEERKLPFHINYRSSSGHWGRLPH